MADVDRAVFDRIHKELQGKGRTPPLVALRGVAAFPADAGDGEEAVYPVDYWPGEEVELRVDPDEPGRRQQRWRVALMVAKGFFVPKDEYDPKTHGGPWKTREEHDRDKEAETHTTPAFQAAVAAGVAHTLRGMGVDPANLPKQAAPKSAKGAQPAAE